MGVFSDLLKNRKTETPDFQTLFANVQKEKEQPVNLVDPLGVGRLVTGATLDLNLKKEKKTPADFEGQTISADTRKQSPLRELISKFKPLEEGLFGNQIDLGQEEVDKGLLGFALPSITKTDTEKYFDRYNKLIEIGTDKERANEIVMDELFNEQKDLSLTKEEKKILRTQNLFEVGGTLLDIAQAPTGGIVGKTSRVGLARLTKLASEKASQEVIEQTLKEVAPKLTDDAIAEIAPKILKETSTTKIDDLIKGALGTEKISPALQNIADDDLGEVIDFVDDVRLGREPTVDNEIAVRRLAEKFNLNPDQSNARLANLLQKKIDEVPEVLSKVANRLENVEKEVAKRERGFITSAKEVLPDAPKIAGQYVPRSTNALAQKAANLVKDDARLAEKIALEGTDDKSVAVASELLKDLAAKAEATSDIAVQDALYDRAAKIANTVAERLTEQGRSIQAASILGRLTPEGQVRFAAREIQKWNRANPRNAVPELTGSQAKEITEEMKAIQLMEEGEEKAIRFQELQNKIRSMVPSKWWEKAIAVWKAGLLTGLKTSGLNIFSNLAHTGLEVVKDVPAAGADTLLSLLTGERTVVASVKGLPSGVKEGAQKGWRYLRTGYDTRDVAKKLDYKRVNFNNKVIQSYVDGVFRLLGTQDQIFYYGALKRSLYNQAKAAAKTKKLKGEKVDEFIDKFVTEPDDVASGYALADAETAVFQNTTNLGRIAQTLQRIPGGEFVVPFGKTPSAVAMQVIYYSPAGAFIELGKQAARGKLDQRVLAQAIGRSTIGTGVVWAGGELYKNDLMTLDYPSTERERELWKAEGRKANSIKIGDEWRTVQAAGPAGPVLLIGGHFQRAMEETGSHTEAMTTAAFGTIKSFTEQTFLQGVNQVMETIADPQLWNVRSLTSSFVSSFIPTIINDVARSIDPNERRTSSNSFLKEVGNRIKGRIPKLRETLEPQIDIMGRERERVGNALEVMLDPTRPSPDVSTEVVDELRRLYDDGYKVSPTMLGDRAGYEVLTDEENTELWKRTGEILSGKLENLFASQTYQKKSDEQKAKTVEEFVEKTKVISRAEMTIKLTEGLEGNELKETLSDLKAAKFLTEDVYDAYKRLK